MAAAELLNRSRRCRPRASHGEGFSGYTNFGALSRGFGTCCLRFKNGVATCRAGFRLAGFSLYREGVEPSGSLQKISGHPSSSSGVSLAQGKFHCAPSPPDYSDLMFAALTIGHHFSISAL
jgi:hypothetical protein